MNWPIDTPDWLVTEYQGMEAKARLMVANPKPEVSSDRAAGYFAAVNDLRERIEYEARTEHESRQARIDEMKARATS